MPTSSWLVRQRYNLRTAFGLAFDSVRAHKLRSLLTLLGVIIGVGSVIVVGSAIEGLGAYAEESTAKVFGSETFLIAKIGSAASRKEYLDKLKRNREIRVDDYKFVDTTTGDRVLYSPYTNKTLDVKHENAIYEDAVIIGTGAALPDMRDVGIDEGRFFTDQEERTRQDVAVIGQDIVAQLFAGTRPLGNTIKINGIDFTVVGIQERLGSSFGRSQDNSVYIPFTTFRRMFGTGQSIAFFGRARQGTGMTLMDALDLTRVALRTRFRQNPREADRFDNVTPEAIRSFIDNILGMISAVIIPVTCISLVVGGIVIMNIMLVSVTERTREIGVRKSLGAKRSDILLQFLLEAVLLAAAGGAVGVLGGAGMTALLAKIFDLTLRVTTGYVALALVVSSTVGIVSGFYPAMRASRLDPITALRAE